MTGWNSFGDGAVVDAAGFVAAAQRLLDGAVVAAGGGRQDLVGGLGPLLALDGPHATLRLDVGIGDRSVRAELAAAAEAASELVLRLVAAQPTTGADGPADIRSNCVGYLWTPPVVDLLLAGPHLHPARNLYNEWQWQLVLLRDALIPFTDPGRVRFRADRDGLTRLRGARDRFAVEVMTRRIAHASLTRFAAALLVGPAAPERDFYGFQTGGALVLPPVALDGPLLHPTHLLDVRAGGLVEEEPAFFVPAETDPLAVPAVPLTAPPRSREDVTVVALSERLVPGTPDHDGARTLTLVVGFDGHEWSVDLGQALRGHRYAGRVTGGATAAASAATWSGCAVLREDGAVTVPSGGVVPTGGQRGLVLALLGRLRPGSVVLWDGTGEPGPGDVLLDVRG